MKEDTVSIIPNFLVLIGVSASIASQNQYALNITWFYALLICSLVLLGFLVACITSAKNIGEDEFKKYNYDMYRMAVRRSKRPEWLKLTSIGLNVAVGVLLASQGWFIIAAFWFISIFNASAMYEMILKKGNELGLSIEEVV